MTPTEVKSKIKAYLMKKISEVKEYCTFNFPIVFPAIVIDEPEQTKQWVGFGVLKESFIVKITVLAPAQIDRDKTLMILNDICNKINLQILSDPTMEENFTEVSITKNDPTKIILKENVEQNVELVGIAMQFKIYNLIT